MAERNQNPAAAIWNRISHPVDAIGGALRSRVSDITTHPWQSGISAAGGLLATLFGGPIAGQAASGGIRNLFGRHNDNQFNQGAAQLLNDTNNRVSDQIWSQWQQGGGSGAPPQIQPAQQDDPNEHPSQLRSSDGRVDMTRFGGQQQAPAPIYQGQQGAATSLGGMGRTVGTASMGQVEDMLGAGIGRNDIASHLTQSREMSQMRDQARANGPRPPGMSVMEWFRQNS